MAVMLMLVNDVFIKICKVIYFLYIFKHYLIFFERKLVQTSRSFLLDLTKIKKCLIIINILVKK